MNNKYEIQMADVTEVGRPFTIDNPLGDLEPTVWETVASGETAEQALLDLLEEMNAENIDLGSIWLRCLTPNGNVLGE